MYNTNTSGASCILFPDLALPPELSSLSPHISDSPMVYSSMSAELCCTPEDNDLFWVSGSRIQWIAAFPWLVEMLWSISPEIITQQTCRLRYTQHPECFH